MPESTQKHYTELDGVRAIAALMVMFLHFFQKWDRSSSALIAYLSKIANLGQSGVVLFFVLSGFLITRILLRTQNSDNYFKVFYVRRALRIFPLYYLYLILVFFVVPAFTTDAPYVPFHKQAYYWVYLQNVATTFKWPCKGPSHFWSLAVEEHFYLFWSLLIYISDKKQLLRGCVAIIIIGIISRIVLLQNNYDPFWFTLTNMDSLAMGSILAIWEPAITGKHLSGKSKRLFTSAFFVTLIPTGVLWFKVGGKHEIYVQAIKPLLLNIICFSFIGRIIASQTGRLVNILKNKVLTYLGKISYGLYVYHPLCYFFFFTNTITNNILFSFIVCFTSSIITASASYYLFEVKLLNLKKYFVYKNADKAIVQPEVIPALQPSVVHNEKTV